MKFIRVIINNKTVAIPVDDIHHMESDCNNPDKRTWLEMKSGEMIRVSGNIDDLLDQINK